jgi:aubergine-like protein
MDYRYLNNEDPEVWKKEIKQYAYNSKYNIVLILLDDYLNKIGLYDELKYFSQENEGIISQFILTNSFTRKNGMSVVSNILIQINTKIGGISYVIDFDKNIKAKHLMIIGVNSSKLIIDKVPHLSISYCASLNDDFTEYTNKKEILNEEENRNNSLCIGLFLYEALIEYYKKNKKFPGGVIIYRQGISEGKESVIMGEIEQINDILTGNSPYETIKGLIIPYYYILVNKRATIKFFESSPDSDENDYYENPENGLLVIRKAVRDEIFEFYIQPQKVNSGTATPTNYRVMYGTMNNHDILPKLSFDLCYLYSNWRGPVRIPAPLKYAEKLAKLKYGINDNIKNSLCFI